jgi:hypothetical protein
MVVTMASKAMKPSVNRKLYLIRSILEVEIEFCESYKPSFQERV